VSVPKHIYVIMAVTFAFFILLWFGVVILGQTPTQALVASILTLFLLSFGVTFSLTSLRGDRSERD
jgi:hypothetical protein